MFSLALDNFCDGLSRALYTRGVIPPVFFIKLDK